MVKISVILPIYNVEDYLEETLTCLLNQTMVEDIEVLMVDDGSTDDSRYIIEKYALDYDNFHAFHKANEGQGIARNYALKFAKGEYVHFLDSDDYIPPDAYETLYNLALKNNSDIIIGDVLRFGNTNIWSDSLFKNSFSGITEDIESTTLAEMPSLLWDTSTSNKLYKKDFILKNDIRFPDRKIFFEDLVFSAESYIKASSVYISKYVFYYWRFRGRKTSVTQQHTDFNNFYDRIQILKIIDNLMKENNLDDDLVHYEYKKWLNHDLKIFIKKINNYPDRFNKELVKGVNEILDLIPHEFLDELNSYKRITYEMILNEDIEALKSFAPFEKDVINNEYDLDSLDEKYLKFIDFKRDSVSEDLTVILLGVDSNDDELLIRFTEKIGFLDSNYYQYTLAYVVDDNSEFSVDIKDNSFIVPFDLIRDKSRIAVKVKYREGELLKESYLRNRKPQSFEFDDFYLDFSSGIDNLLVIDVLDKNENEIEITNVDFIDDSFVFEGKSKRRIESLFIKNVLSFDEIEYSIDHIADKFKLTIPYNDILNVPIKKWELNSRQFPNTVKTSMDYNFYIGNNNIKILNQRNKILIDNSLCNLIEELTDVQSQIHNLNYENRQLKKSNRQFKRSNKKYNKANEKLNKEIEEFKSRKVVKVVDKIKSINKSGA